MRYVSNFVQVECVCTTSEALFSAKIQKQRRYKLIIQVEVNELQQEKRTCKLDLISLSDSIYLIFLRFFVFATVVALNKEKRDSFFFSQKGIKTKSKKNVKCKANNIFN